MSKRSLFGRFHGSPATSHLFCRTPLARTLRCEPLEDRRLLAVLTVNTDQDTIDFTDGLTSLREAVFAANIVPGADEIVFDFGHDGPATILLTHGELQITNPLTIIGPGAGLLTIDASGNDPTPDVNNGDGSRVFNITNGGATSHFNVALEGLTLTGGDSSNLGGAIFSNEDLLLTACVVTDNSAIHGGGIHAFQVEVVDSIISGNVARTMGGRDPNGGYGGGITADDIVLTRSTVQGNTGRLGGGVFGSNMTIESSLIGSNQGGGIFQSGQLLVSNSAVVNNAGAGIFMQLSTGTIHNSTISGNAFRGVNAQGGLIHIEYSTITNNRATFGNTSGVFATGLDGQVTVRSSIIAGNPEGDLGTLTTQNNFTSEGYNLVGTGNGTAAFTQPGDQVGVTNPSLGPLAYNGGPTPTHALLLASPAINAGDPASVGGVNGVPLFDQRGEPFTRVSRGRIDIGAFEPQLPEGDAFVVDTLADENDGNYSDGDLSLREAVALANRFAGVDRIEFAPELAGGTIFLTLAELVVTDAVDIVGLGADLLTIDNSRTQGPIFNIDVVSPSLIEVSISGVTLTGSRNSAIRSVEDLTVDSVIIRGNEGNLAGGIRVESGGQQAQNARLTVRNSLITDNRSTGAASFSAGGILFVGRSGALEISNSTFTANQSVSGGGGVTAAGFDNLMHIVDTLVEDNSGRQGGGIYITDDNRQLALLERVNVRDNVASGGLGGGLFLAYKAIEIVDSSITGNRTNTTPASNAGGGIFKTGGDPFTIRGTTISDNHTAGTGGGISLQNSPLELIDSVVSDNSSMTMGGGINGVSSPVTIERSTVAGNSTQGSGGGLSLRSGSLVIRDSTFSHNHADKSGGGVSVASPGARFTSSTLSSNTAGQSGGGIASSASLTVAHSTITNNTADSNADGVGEGGGIHAEGAVPNVLDHTIVAGNVDLSGVAPDTAGNILANQSLIGVGAEFLGPLADNGGPTLTHALLPGSPAINAGDPASAGGATGVDGVPFFDQRGEPFVRVFGDAIDIGAFESQSLIVDTLADENDGDYSAGDFSLREAIALANKTAGANTIEFAPSLAGGTILLTMGELSIWDSVEVIGLGADQLTIDASGNDPTPDLNNGDGSRVFRVDDGGATGVQIVTLAGMTITGGDSMASGGGIYNRENLTLRNVTVTNNNMFGIRHYGGGVYTTAGTLAIIDSGITGNATPRYSGGGVGVQKATLIVSDSVITDNTAGSGGGVIAFDGQVTITDTVVEGNHANGIGGGIYISQSTFLMSASTVRGNSSTQEGGGLSLFTQQATILDSLIVGNSSGVSAGGIRADTNSGLISILQSTISDNSAPNGSGLQTYVSNAAGRIEVAHSTIADNEATSATGGAIFVIRGPVDLSHSIVAGNAMEGQPEIAVFVPTFPTTLPPNVTARHSLIGTNAGTTLAEAPAGSPDTNGNLIGGPVHGVIDPLLGPLADNGGPTLTHALLPGGPAINSGEVAAATGVDGVPEFDQRGEPFVRVFGDAIDIGAFEAQSLIVDTLVDESDGDFSEGDFSLREAIALANKIAGANTIEFAPSLAGGTILLEHGELVITDALEVNGLGAELLTIDAQQQSRVILVDGRTTSTPRSIDVNLNGITLTGGLAPDDFTTPFQLRQKGGGILFYSTGVLSINDGTIFGNAAAGRGSSTLREGGGIYSFGNVNLVDSSVSNNVGTGIDILQAGATVTRSRIDDNTGGGLIAVQSQSVPVTVTESSVSGNQFGGILAWWGPVTVVDSVVSNNGTPTGNSFSGISSGRDHLTVIRSTVSGNYAQGGGGLWGGGNITVIDSTISGNHDISSTFQFGGGGIFQQPMPGAAHSVTISNSVISGNTSTSRGGGIFTSGNTVIADSLINDNHSDGLGGGIFGHSTGIVGAPDVTITLVRSTIDGNTARGGRQSGAGIFAYGDVTVSNSTISNNNHDVTAPTFGGIVGRNVLLEQSTISGNGGGGVATGGGTLTALHSTVTANKGTGLSGNNVSLSHTIVAGNIFSSAFDRDVFFTSLTATYSLISAGADYLGPLADNGGPTKTHALLPGSPAINAGDPTARAGVNGFPEFDQRGAPFARFGNGLHIDIGAFELQPASGALTGDFDGDGDGDGRDFLIWQRGYGGTFVDPYFHGDATRDGDVDGLDLEVWEATYGENEPLAISDQSASADLRLSASQESRAESPEPESGSRLWTLDSLLFQEPVSDDDLLFREEPVEVLSIDRAFDDWPPAERTRFDFGDIVTRRAVKPRLLGR